MAATKTYRFRWSNYDLGRYLKERRRKADDLMREAEALAKRAAAIAAEADELENALEPVPEPGSEKVVTP